MWRKCHDVDTPRLGGQGRATWNAVAASLLPFSIILLSPLGQIFLMRPSPPLPSRHSLFPRLLSGSASLQQYNSLYLAAWKVLMKYLRINFTSRPQVGHPDPSQLQHFPHASCGNANPGPPLTSPTYILKGFAVSATYIYGRDLTLG